MTTYSGESGSRGPTGVGSLGRLARRTFDALSTEQARAVLEVRPDPVATIHRQGPHPYRILFFGGGVLRGVGLRDHDRGLPGLLADRIAASTRRGVRIDVVVEDEPTKPAALAGLMGLRLRRYDAVVVVLGESHGPAQAADRWRGALVSLVDLLVKETCGVAGLFVYESRRAVAGTQATVRGSRSALQSARLVEVTEQVCSLTDRVRFAELLPIFTAQDAAGGFSAATHAEWADLVAERLEPALAAVSGPDTPRAFRNRPQDERFRQRALDSLRLRRGERDPYLDREVEAARSMYRMSGAAFTVIDGPVQWSKASTREQPPVFAREAGICNVAITSDELTLINDTWFDARTKAGPLVRGSESIRFYAGYPVHSPDGYRIGMLCIYSTTPRCFTPLELEGLRDIAARVERHVWNDVLKTRRA